MDFEVYCDESGLEALTRKDAHLYTGIGGIWIPKEHRITLKKGIATIKHRYQIKGELKWQKVSPAYFDLYKDLVDFFFISDYIRFRLVLIEASKVDHITFNNEDAELGFYKFYYQLLHHWIFDFNNYDIFLDLKINRNRGRLKELERVLDHSNLTSDVKQVQGLPSGQSLGIQLVDVLTGLVTAKFNKEVTGRAKVGLIQYLEEKYLSKPIAPTPKWAEKFNVFRIDLKGGW
jgi:Protein of unknown function (DUF3800)